jgi:hypothetical protein
MTDEEAARQFARLPDLVNGNAALVRRGRFLTTEFLVGAGALPVYVSVQGGIIADVALGPALMRAWRFAIRAGAGDWGRFWQATPAPGWHDILAMKRFGHATIEGDLQPLMANLRYIKEVLEAPRRAGGEADDGD